MKQVNIAPTQAHADFQAAFNDAQWQALKSATPAQIDTWLTNNVTNLAQARTVLRLLLLAVRYLAAR